MANIMRLNGAGSSKIIDLGTVTIKTGAENYGGTDTITFNISSKYSNYKNITKDNIILGLTKTFWYNISPTQDNPMTTNWAWTYNPSNGVITITGNRSGGYKKYVETTINVYVVEGSVKRI